MIRTATKYDMPYCVEMMRRYAREAPILALQNPAVHNDLHVQGLLTQLIEGRGFVLVDDKMRGMLAAIITRNVWCPDVLELRELAWWIEPEHRKGMIGGRLFLEFSKRAKELLAVGRVQCVYASLMVTSDLQSLPGWTRIDSTFLKD